MIPETKPDHDIRFGSCVEVVGGGNFVVFGHLEGADAYILRNVEDVHEAIVLGREYIYDRCRIPQATYCIWDTPTCTCGAAYMSFPNQHMRFCGEYK